MGRYYSGDIEGKFWFGVQPSDDASFFGAEPNEPNSLEYCFDETDKESVEHGVKECHDRLGDYVAKLDDYFKAESGYDDKSLAGHLSVSEGELHGLLKWYARLELGRKIQKSLEEKGGCCFEAEL